MMNHEKMLALISAHRAGNNKAFGELYLALQQVGMHKYASSGFRNAVRFEDAQDIVSDTTVKLLEKFKTDSISMDRLNLSFVKICFHNAFLDRIRQDRNHKKVSLDEGFDREDDSTTFSVESTATSERSNTDEMANHNDLRSQIRKLVSTLGPKQAQVATLRFLEGFSPEEIATELGMKPDQVYLNTCLAKKKLMKWLLKLGYKPE